MLKAPLILLFAMLFLCANAQREGEAYKTTIRQFERIYNRSNYDSIFYFFSPEMKKAISQEKITKLLRDTKDQAGNMMSHAFERYESSYACYKGVFERRDLSLYISLDNSSKINGLFIQPYVSAKLPTLERNKTPLTLPFKGVWTVLWGGDTKALNYHIEVPAQKGAFDFFVTDTAGKAYKSASRTNEDYYAFGKEIVAACDGEIVLAVDGIKDNLPGTVNPMFVTGNTVILKTSNNEYILYAHFKNHSVAVKEGQSVKQGELLGLCGNSGNSSEPHLHFHIQNVEDINIATGASCYFDTLIVNGVEKKNYSPKKGERIKNKED
jgi:murein DD-endopeptidase MepM/ murein hydrolase activator NlpD